MQRFIPMFVRGSSTLTKYAAQILTNSRTQSGFYDWFMALKKDYYLFFGRDARHVGWCFVLVWRYGTFCCW